MYAYHKYSIYMSKWQQKKGSPKGNPFMQVVSPFYTST